MRYRGQSYEIEVRLTPHFAADFHAAHRHTFGHAAPEARGRSRQSCACARLRPALSPRPSVLRARVGGRAPSPVRRIQVIADGRTAGGTRTVPVYARDAIGAGARIRGPAIVVELSATAYVAPEFTLRADDFGNLHLEA